MQANKLNAAHGWLWIRAGWLLFKRQPIAFAALLFGYLFTLLFASLVVGLAARAISSLIPALSADLVAALGSALIATLTPGLTAGFMEACRRADTGAAISPVLLLAPFRSGRDTVRQLLVLGFVQVGALICIVLLTGAIDTPQTAQEASSAASASASAPATTRGATDSNAASPSAGAAHAEAEPNSDAIRHAAIVSLFQALAYLPVAMLMWYAPVLVVWHRLSAMKALFFSGIAVGRNIGPFIVYGIVWIAIWSTLSMVLALLVRVMGLGNFSALLAAPAAMLILTWMYCSFYPTYATVFVAGKEST